MADASFIRTGFALALMLLFGNACTAHGDAARHMRATMSAPHSSPAPHDEKDAESSTSGMVSAADPRAAAAGIEILRKGGSATDAAIATMIALSVVEPQSSGIGGGGFLLHADERGKITSYDGRETAPFSATPDWFLDDAGHPLPHNKAKLSGLSVGVPGNIRLAELVHRQHGKLPWAEVFQPAIRLARDGFHITARLHLFLTRYQDAASHDAQGAALFYAPDGTPKPQGTLVRNPMLAQTLEALAKNGADYLHKGAFAQKLAEKVASATPHGQKRGARMNVADLAAYQAKMRDPLCGPYRIWVVCSMGPPSSGATTVLAILGQLERFDMAALGSDSPVAWHLFAEAQRLAYADRAHYLADPDFIAVPAAGLIDPAYLAARSAAISPDHTMKTALPGQPAGAPASLGQGLEPVENGTSHLVVADKQGRVASYTSTIEGPFGAGLMAGGMYLNNELTDFSFLPAQSGQPAANRVEGGKRPRSSMAPSLVLNQQGKVVLAVGAAGGATIPAQVARAIIGVLDWELNAEQAAALPVLFAPGDVVFVEQASSLETMIPALQHLGHTRIEARELPLKTNLIHHTAGGWHGAADPRSEGISLAE